MAAWLAVLFHRFVTRCIEPRRPVAIDERARIMLLNTLLVIFVPLAPVITFIALILDKGSIQQAWANFSLVTMLLGSLALGTCYAVGLLGHYRTARYGAFLVAVAIILTQIHSATVPVEIFFLLAIPAASTLFMSRRDSLIICTAITALIVALVVTDSRIPFTARTSYVLVATVLIFLITIISIFRDRLEKLRSAELLAKEREVQAQRERMHVMTNLIRSASHDLRTPLSIMNTSIALAERSPSAETRSRHLEKLKATTGFLQIILEKMFTMARLEDLSSQESHAVELTTLFNALVINALSLAELARVTLRSNIPSELPRIMGYTEELHMALMELLRNAIQHSRAEGEVFIQVILEMSALKISIEDQGSGISAEHLPHVFDLFYRIEEHRPLDAPRAGLGLSIAKKVIEAHGGTIALTSIEGQGTRVVVTLPRETPLVSRGTATAAHRSSAAHRPHTASPGVP